jgi:mono/diheme cytochrome c family protein
VRRLALILVGSALVLAGCGGGETVRPLPTKVIGTIATTPVEKGDPAAGKEVFTAQGCGSCHTFKAAGSTATVGPNLDEVLKGKSPDFVHESIVNPNAEIAKGYAPNVMPQTYGSDLSAKQLADLVAFLTQK